MTTSWGYRSRTKHKFKKAFRRHGAVRISNYLKEYKKGDYVDIIVDGAIHKGMPHKFYHGRTGKVFNVNPRTVGVIVEKQVKQRKLEKKIHVRIEHLRHSNSRLSFLERVKENEAKKAEAKKAGVVISTKRQPLGPRSEKKVQISMDNIKAANFLPHLVIH